MTPRQELIKQSAARLRVWRNEKIAFILPGAGVRYPQAHHALEAITDECRTEKPGTLGAAMLAYYRGITPKALARLIHAVSREARPKTFYKHDTTIKADYAINWSTLWNRKEAGHGQKV